MNRIGQILQGLAAVIVVVAVCVGAPLALIAWGDLHVLARLATPSGWLVGDDGTLLIGVITVIGWLAWFGACVSLIGEVIRRASGLRIALRFPGISLFAPASSVLVTAILGLIGLQLTGLVSRPAGINPSLDLEPASMRVDADEEPSTPQASQAEASTTVERTHLVISGDDLWTIAETYYGDGMCWRFIAEANESVLMGSVDLMAGMVLHLPDCPAQPPGAVGDDSSGDDAVYPHPTAVDTLDPSAYPRASTASDQASTDDPLASGEVVTVEPGDTLSELAETHLGDGERWDLIVAVNHDLIVDPDWIEPGWQLTIPSDLDADEPRSDELFDDLGEGSDQVESLEPSPVDGLVAAGLVEQIPGDDSGEIPVAPVLAPVVETCPIFGEGLAEPTPVISSDPSRTPGDQSGSSADLSSIPADHLDLGTAEISESVEQMATRAAQAAVAAKGGDLEGYLDYYRVLFRAFGLDDSCPVTDPADLQTTDLRALTPEPFSENDSTVEGADDQAEETDAEESQIASQQSPPVVSLDDSCPVTDAADLPESDEPVPEAVIEPAVTSPASEPAPVQMIGDDAVEASYFPDTSASSAIFDAMVLAMGGAVASAIAMGYARRRAQQEAMRPIGYQLPALSEPAADLCAQLNVLGAGNNLQIGFDETSDLQIQPDKHSHLQIQPEDPTEPQIDQATLIALAPVRDDKIPVREDLASTRHDGAPIHEDERPARDDGAPAGDEDPAPLGCAPQTRINLGRDCQIWWTLGEPLTVVSGDDDEVYALVNAMILMLTESHQVQVIAGGTRFEWLSTMDNEWFTVVSDEQMIERVNTLVRSTDAQPESVEQTRVLVVDNHTIRLPAEVDADLLARSNVSIIVVGAPSDDVKASRELILVEGMLATEDGYRESCLIHAPARRGLSEIYQTANSNEYPQAWWWDHRQIDPVMVSPLAIDHIDMGIQPEASGHPFVRLLGPIVMDHAHGTAPTRSAKACMEYCAWMLENPASTPAQLSRSLMVADTTRRSTISRLRSWLGASDQGESYLPEAYHGQLSLHPAVTSDWERMKLLVRSVNRTPTHALAHALALVRGAPLADAAPGQWQWAEQMRADMVAMIVDIAVELTGRYARAGRDHQAMWAAEQGLLASPYNEHLLCWAMKIAHRNGDQARVDSLLVTLTRHAKDLGVDLCDETITTVQEIMEGAPRARVPVAGTAL